MSFVPRTPSTSDGDGKVTLRRLLLAKQLFLHAAEHGKKLSGIDKIIAVHNFHNSIEVTLKAILFHYAISTSKSFNIDFETLVKDIDDHFRPDGIQLPYRSDIRSLNNARNMVQHNAHEPEAPVMDEWRVFTVKFLRLSFEQYFALDFDQLSQIELIEDEMLKKLLQLAAEMAASDSAQESLILSRFGMDYARESCVETPDFSYQLSFNSSPGDTDNEIREALDELVGDIESFASDVEQGLTGVSELLSEIAESVAFLACGVNLVDYKRFLRVTPEVNYVTSGSERDPRIDEINEARAGGENSTAILADGHQEQSIPRVNQIERRLARWGSRKPNREDAQWAVQFVTATIVQLQNWDPTPKLPEQYADFAQELVRTRGKNVLSYGPVDSMGHMVEL